MIIRFIPLPPHVHGFVTRKVEADGEYDTIVLNSRDSAYVQRETYEHEVRHIEYGHFDSNRPLFEIEAEAEHGKEPHNAKR